MTYLAKISCGDINKYINKSTHTYQLSYTNLIYLKYKLEALIWNKTIWNNMIITFHFWLYPV